MIWHDGYCLLLQKKLKLNLKYFLRLKIPIENENRILSQKSSIKEFLYKFGPGECNSAKTPFKKM